MAAAVAIGFANTFSHSLLLIPANEGTEVHTAGSKFEIRQMLEAGLSMAEAAIPYTRPANSEQLMFAEL